MPDPTEMTHDEAVRAQMIDAAETARRLAVSGQFTEANQAAYINICKPGAVKSVLTRLQAAEARVAELEAALGLAWSHVRDDTPLDARVKISAALAASKGALGDG